MRLTQIHLYLNSEKQEKDQRKKLNKKIWKFAPNSQPQVKRKNTRHIINSSIGSLPFMACSGPSPSLLHGIIEKVKKHGPIFGFYFGKTPAVIIADYLLVS